jgi:hypothetical protein
MDRHSCYEYQDVPLLDQSATDIARSFEAPCRVRVPEHISPGRCNLSSNCSDEILNYRRARSPSKLSSPHPFGLRPRDCVKFFGDLTLECQDQT